MKLIHTLLFLVRENYLVAYLDTHDEPMISCGIVNQYGETPFLDDPPSILPKDPGLLDEYFEKLRRPLIVPGFTNPCIHNAKILKETGAVFCLLCITYSMSLILVNISPILLCYL